MSEQFVELKLGVPVKQKTLAEWAEYIRTEEFVIYAFQMRDEDYQALKARLPECISEQIVKPVLESDLPPSAIKMCLRSLTDKYEPINQVSANAHLELLELHADRKRKEWLGKHYDYRFYPAPAGWFVWWSDNGVRGDLPCSEGPYKTFDVAVDALMKVIP